MNLATSGNMVNVPAALATLEPLGPDQYCIAFGPGATRFFATPNGYSAMKLPRKIENDLLGGEIKKVLHASFGSDADSFFFTYEMKNGSVAHRAGRAIPAALGSFAKHISTISEEHTSALRVLLGAHGSYIAWAGAVWISYGIPAQLYVALRDSSSVTNDNCNEHEGKLQTGVIDNVAWHGNGSWFLQNGVSVHNLTHAPTPRVVQEAFLGLCKSRPSDNTVDPSSSIAYIAINPHSATGETFAFFSKTWNDQDPEFVLRFEPEKIVSRLHLKEQGSSSSADSKPNPQISLNLTISQKGAHELQVFQWGVSRHTGRSHLTDSWELELKKGERIKILKHLGNDWFLAENRRNQRGWVHKTLLDFQEITPHAEPRKAYARFSADIDKLMKAGNIRSFPNLAKYMNSCAKAGCSTLKKDPQRLGICVHDLHELMRGVGVYTLDTLKTERNKWHPDRFARYCHPDHRDILREKAQALFVLFGVIMDMLVNPPAPEPAA